MNELWSKARVAKSSARLLLNAGDTDGAVSRAYYAMFDAARVALAAVDAKLAIAKTHQTIIRRFGRHMVIDHGFDPSLGRALNVAEELRLSADYEATPVAFAQAARVVADMERFVDAIEQFLKSLANP